MITFSNLGHYGQLGNQLFQLATLMNIAKYNKYQYGVPINNKEKKFWVHDPRGSFQYGFCLDECFTLPNLKYIPDTSFIKYKHEAKQFNYYPGILSILDNTDILGYFQSEKFFQENKDYVLNEYTFHNSIITMASSIINKYRSYYNTLISVHIRRGDYTRLQEHYPMLTYENYYNKAMSYFKLAGFLIFSDDIEMIKKELGNHKKYIYVDTNDTNIDICLMSMCDHNIIANSSFSWWGAYLNKNKNKIVIAPKLWFGPKYSNLNTVDIIPENWLKF